MLVKVPKYVKGQSFCLYSIDSEADYTGVGDMIPTSVPNVVLTLCQNPEQWFRDNCGMNETPLLYVDAENQKFIRTMFAGNIKLIAE